MNRAPDTRTAFDSPALTYRSEQYPRLGFGGQEERVPYRVRITTDVRSELRDADTKPLLCPTGKVVDAWVNSHGAVAAIMPYGLLGLKPGEFEVVEWHASADAAGAR
jgi:hypothetical protein